MLGRGLFDQAGQLLSHHRPHGSTHEAEIHHRQGHGNVLHSTQPGDDSIAEACSGLGLTQAVGVGAAVLETERISGFQSLVYGFKTAFIGNHGDALSAVDPMVMTAVAADAGIGQQIFAVHHLAAFGTFAPETVALFGLLGNLDNRLFLAAISEPVEQRHAMPSTGTI